MLFETGTNWNGQMRPRDIVEFKIFRQFLYSYIFIIFSTFSELKNAEIKIIITFRRGLLQGFALLSVPHVGIDNHILAIRRI